MNNATRFEPFNLRIEGLGEAAVREVPVRCVWTRTTTSWTTPNRSCGSHLADSRIRDLWETITYAVLWICGLIAIGLC